MKLILTCALTPLLLTSVFADGAFYGDPPDATHPWTIHDMNRPQPPVIKGATASTQEKPGQPPSDAIVLFDGTEASLAKWCSDADPNQPTKWVLRDGASSACPRPVTHAPRRNGATASSTSNGPRPPNPKATARAVATAAFSPWARWKFRSWIITTTRLTPMVSPPPFMASILPWPTP